MKQLSFADLAIQQNRKASRVTAKLDKIDALVDWSEVLKLVKVVDKTQSGLGGAPHKDLLTKVKMLFLQDLYDLSDPELEDQVNDRLSFQRFAGIDFDTTVPDFTTIWRFKEALIKERVMDGLFDTVLSAIEAQGCLVKKGTIVDATLVDSINRPLSRKKREELAEKPSSQIDTDAHSTQKRGKFYFGYKGHIGVDVDSKIIRKREFTSAQPHDSRVKHCLFSGDEDAVFGDSAYSKRSEKHLARQLGIYYGILDKGTRSHKLSASQKKRNRKHSRVRSQVEHPFAYLKTKLGYTVARAKTKARNALKFDFKCILYNIFRADYLLRRA